MPRSPLAPRTRSELAWVMPRLILLACLADLGLRFVAIDGWTFRAWEALQRYRRPGAPFAPARVYENPRAYGDLAALANLPRARQYRPERFSTDALGFRNPAAESGAPVAAMVVGDSFTVGSGVDDGANLTSRLGRLFGCRVYNAGGIEPDPDRIRSLATRLGMTSGLVIHELHEVRPPPRVPSAGRRAWQRALGALPPELGAAFGAARGFWGVSPLRIACERALKGIRDDRVLPNSYAREAVRLALSNGDPMLFRASALRELERPRQASARNNMAKKKSALSRQERRVPRA